MLKYLLVFTGILLSYTYSTALEPLRVAFNTTETNTQVKVELYDYTDNDLLYTEDLGTLNANSFGNITFLVGDGIQDWTDIPSSDINSNVVLNIKTGLDETLYAQYRVDQLAINQAMTGTGEALQESDLGGSEGGVSVLTAQATESVEVNYTDTYRTQQGMTLNLEANSAYMIRGYFERSRESGPDSEIDYIINYDGTVDKFYFDNLNDIFTSSNEVLNASCNFNSFVPDNFLGFIRTSTSGTLSFQFKKSTGATTDPLVNSESELILIKVE